MTFRSAIVQDALSLPTAVWRSGAYFSPIVATRRRRSYRQAGVPNPRLSWPGVASVVADELVAAGFRITRNPPTRDEWRRIVEESAAAVAVADASGWTGEPRSFHRIPEPIEDEVIVDAPRQYANGLPFRQLRWTSTWAPHDSMPGSDRWAGYERVPQANAWLLEHDDAAADRPWVVIVHGTEQGRLAVDARIFRVRHLYETLGANVILPVLPLHGSRRPHERTDSGFPTLDVVDDIHGLAHSAHDVRAVIDWVRRERNPSTVCLAGLSLGGGVAALVAGLHDGIDSVVAFVPAADFPELFRRQTPVAIKTRRHFSEMDQSSEVLHRLVSPLSFEARVPVEHRRIVAGLHDRLLDPRRQAHALASHWGVDVDWVDRGHVTHMVTDVISASFTAALART